MEADLLRQSIVEEAADGSKTFIPVHLFPGIEVKDVAARRGLGLALAGGAVLLAADAALHLNELARSCVNEGVLRIAMGGNAVGFRTCAVEGFQWLVMAAKDGLLWK